MTDRLGRRPGSRILGFDAVLVGGLGLGAGPGRPKPSGRHADPTRILPCWRFGVRGDPVLLDRTPAPRRTPMNDNLPTQRAGSRNGSVPPAPDTPAPAPSSHEPP